MFDINLHLVGSRYKAAIHRVVDKQTAAEPMNTVTLTGIESRLISEVIDGETDFWASLPNVATAITQIVEHYFPEIQDIVNNAVFPIGFEMFGHSEAFERRAASARSRKLPYCTRCGRALKNGYYSVEVVDGGAGVALPGGYSEYTDKSGYMGLFDFGPECVKSIPSKYRIKN